MIRTTVESAGIATPPPLAPETPVAEAADRLREPDVSVLPVLDDERVVGS
jgi:CBS domain-containing protein